MRCETTASSAGRQCTRTAIAVVRLAPFAGLERIAACRQHLKGWQENNRYRDHGLLIGLHDCHGDEIYDGARLRELAHIHDDPHVRTGTVFLAVTPYARWQYRTDDTGLGFTILGGHPDWYELIEDADTVPNGRHLSDVATRPGTLTLDRSGAQPESH